jgi:hypothetical protein
MCSIESRNWIFVESGAGHVGPTVIGEDGDRAVAKSSTR